MTDVIDLTLKIKQRDLEQLSEHILQKAIELSAENKRLLERLEHLEELLKNVDVVDIGEKK